MDIQKNLTNVNFNFRNTLPRWIVVHNTANGTSREGTAYNNTVYFKDTYRSASAHYFIDDGDTVWQCVRDTDTAWHVGEAQSRNGCYNTNSIGIEVCETAGGWFTDKEIATLRELVRGLMDFYGIPAERVCRHHDVTGKDCPWYYSDDDRWAELKAQITEDDMITKDDANAIWAFDNWGDQEGALKGTAWRNLIDTNKRIQVVEKDVAELSKKVDAIARKLGA